jgi:hypothetical protein
MKFMPSTPAITHKELSSTLVVGAITNLIPHVLFNKSFQEHMSGNEEKHTKNADELHKRSHPTSH